MSCFKDTGVKPENEPAKRIIVSGIVIDALTKQPLSNVNITITNGKSSYGYSSEEALNIKGVSAQNGIFFIDYYTNVDRSYDEIDIKANSQAKLTNDFLFSKPKGWPNFWSFSNPNLYQEYINYNVYHEKNTDSIFYQIELVPNGWLVLKPTSSVPNEIIDSITIEVNNKLVVQKKDSTPYKSPYYPHLDVDSVTYLRLNPAEYGIYYIWLRGVETAKYKVIIRKKGQSPTSPPFVATGTLFCKSKDITVWEIPF